MLPVASSGIAATLLRNGQTAHTMFKIPIELPSDGNGICFIPEQGRLAETLRSASLLIWDEVAMASRLWLEIVDRTLRQIRRRDEPMGGLLTLLGGKFRQILPVVRRGTEVDVVAQCLKSSTL